MSIKINEKEYENLMFSSIGCDGCEMIIEKIKEKEKTINLFDLTIREIIHLGTTTKRESIKEFSNKLIKEISEFTEKEKQIGVQN